jgi:hypothetical protein
MFAMVFAAHLLAVCRVKDFWEVASNWGDNPPYLDIVRIIENGRYSGEKIWHFWGFPYAIAGISKLFSMPGIEALVLISVLGSLGVCILIHRLYGGWVAFTFFSFINYRWIYTSMEGGSEPLFMCLLFASFLAARSGRWNIAALLAALSTTVRPVGVFSLAAFALVLSMRRSYRRLIVITLTGLVVGGLYVILLWIILGSPFANFTGYREDWGPHGWPLTYPFGAIIPSLLAPHEIQWPNFVLSITWIAMASVGTVAMWLPRNRPRFLPYQPEVLFSSMYTLFFLSYGYGRVFEDLPRFLMPVAPLVLFSLRNWILKDRRVLWGAAGLSALLASATIVGFKNVFGFKLP